MNAGPNCYACSNPNGQNIICYSTSTYCTLVTAIFNHHPVTPDRQAVAHASSGQIMDYCAAIKISILPLTVEYATPVTLHSHCPVTPLNRPDEFKQPSPFLVNRTSTA